MICIVSGYSHFKQFSWQRHQRTKGKMSEKNKWKGNLWLLKFYFSEFSNLLKLFCHLASKYETPTFSSPLDWCFLTRYSQRCCVCVCVCLCLFYTYAKRWRVVPSTHSPRHAGNVRVTLKVIKRCSQFNAEKKSQQGMLVHFHLSSALFFLFQAKILEQKIPQLVGLMFIDKFYFSIVYMCIHTYICVHIPVVCTQVHSWKPPPHWPYIGLLF